MIYLIQKRGLQAPAACLPTTTCKTSPPNYSFLTQNDQHHKNTFKMNYFFQTRGLQAPAAFLPTTTCIYWDRFGIIFWIMLGSIWDHFGIILGSFWDRFGIIFGSCSDHFGIDLGSFWDRFGIMLGSFWDRFCNMFGIIVGSL